MVLVLSLGHLVLYILYVPYQVLITHSYGLSGFYIVKRFWGRGSEYVSSRFEEFEDVLLQMSTSTYDGLSNIDQHYAVYILPITGGLRFGPEYRP